MRDPLFHGDGNELFIDPKAVIDDGVRIEFHGDNNKVIIAENARLRHPLVIYFDGHDNLLTIGANCNLRGALHLRQCRSQISIGKGTTAVGAHLFAMEGKKIDIGEDCMFSSGIYLGTSDEHSIYDEATRQRINKASDVTIEDRVWVGEGGTIGKGVMIPFGCVIAARSYVTKTLTRPKSIYAGSPAKLVREGIVWDRRLRTEGIA